MRPEFKHTQQTNKSATSALPTQKQAAPKPAPYEFLRKRNPLAAQALKPGNRQLAPGSKELTPLQPAGAKSNQGIAASTTGKEIVPFQPSAEKKNKFDGLILPEGQLSVDKLLSQWADKIEKAEQEFVLEEIAFERARDRLKARNGRKILQAMPHMHTASMLADSAGRMVRHSQEMSLLGRPQAK